MLRLAMVIQNRMTTYGGTYHRKYLYIDHFQCEIMYNAILWIARIYTYHILERIAVFKYTIISNMFEW